MAEKVNLRVATFDDIPALRALIDASARELSKGSYSPAQIDAAVTHVFGVHPRWARRGLARRLYAACARAAHDAGFREFELMATRPGEPLYLALGFTVVERVATTLPGEVQLPFARMRRLIGLEGIEPGIGEPAA